MLEDDAVRDDAREDRVRDAMDRHLRARLASLKSATGLPVVFGGLVQQHGAGERLVLSRHIGMLGDSLVDLAVSPGRGLGGTAIARGLPCRVNDYTTATFITHDYDEMVSSEKLTSIFAFPVTVQGAVRGVLYGAVRDRRPIGDTALRNAGVIAAHLARDLGGLALHRPEVPPGRPAAPRRPAIASRSATPTRSATAGGAATPAPRSSAALDDLAAVTQTITDPVVRARLMQIHRDLGGQVSPSAPAPAGAASVTPRELDALRLVAVGASNAEIAAELGLSPETVKSYLQSAMRKLEVRNRTAAAHAARSSGLL